MTSPQKLSDKLNDALEKELSADFGKESDTNLTPQAIPGNSTMVSGTMGRARQNVVMPVRVEGYELLESILGKAYEQSAKGKGHARHAHSPVGFRPWHQQPILANARQVGPAGPAQQVMKKVQEAVMMSARGDFEGAKAEALGSIVYAAALYHLFLEMEQAK